MKRFGFFIVILVGCCLINAQSSEAQIVDCNSNGIDDSSALENDCNGNGVPDTCDLSQQTGFLPTNVKGHGVADLNLDSVPDAVSDDGSTVWLNHPGQISSEISLASCSVVGGTYYSRLVGVYDAHHNGLPDIFVLCQTAFDKILVTVRNLGNASFAAPEILYNGISYSVMLSAVADINGDGYFDILAYSTGPEDGFDGYITKIILLINNGSNQLSPVLTSTAVFGDIQFADFNGDHILDALNAAGRIFWNNGTGGFDSNTFLDTGRSGRLQAVDADGDGAEDIFSPGYDASEILYGDGHGGFQAVAVGQNLYEPRLADFNGDGKLDLITVPLLPTTIRPPTEVYLQTSRSSFVLSQRFSNLPGQIVRDLNGDGKADVSGDLTSYVQAPTTHSLDENSNGTPDECESRIAHQTSYSLWNTFLAQTNILELRNPFGISAQIAVTLYDQSGVSVGSVTLVLSPGAEQDLLLNQMFGLAANQYGTVKVDALAGDVRGGVSLYHLENFGPASFADHIPLVAHQHGLTVGVYNDIYPSLGTSGSVQNWLTLVNLDPIHSRKFRLFESVQTVEVPPLGRIDTQTPLLGQTPNSQTASTLRVQPLDDDTLYLAHFSRYGLAVDPNGRSFSYLNSHYLRTLLPNKEYLPIQKAPGTKNFIEIHSPGFNPYHPTNGYAHIRFFDNRGRLRKQVDSAVSDQIHVWVDAELDKNDYGYATVDMDTGTPFLAQSALYFVDAISNLVTASDSSPGVSHFTTDSSSGYNQFLSQSNFVRAINPAASAYAGRLQIVGRSASSLSIPAVAGKRLDITSSRLRNSLGVIGVSSASAQSLAASLLRTQTSSQSGTSFALSAPFEE